jgi:hypothetical protein
MATTKDRLEQLTNVERELHDRDVVAPEDIWGGRRGAVGGCRPGIGGHHPPLIAAVAPARADHRALGGHRRGRLGRAPRHRDRGRAAAHQSRRDRPVVRQCPRYHPVGRGSGCVRRLLAATAVESGGLPGGIWPAGGVHPRVPSVRPSHPGWRLVGRPAGLWARAGGDQHPWTAAGLNRGRRSDRLVGGRRSPPELLGTPALRDPALCPSAIVPRQ